jgi:hypothetical protein
MRGMNEQKAKQLANGNAVQAPERTQQIQQAKKTEDNALAAR